MDRKTEIIITCNTRQPVAAVNAMNNELKKLKATYQQLYNAGKAGSTQAKKIKKDIDDLDAAIRQSETDMSKVDKVVTKKSSDKELH